MQFLRALFWLVLGIALAVFTVGNWRNVTLDIWGGLQADVKIPVLAIGAFLLGFLPMWVANRLRRMRRPRVPVAQPNYTPPPPPPPPAMAPVLDERTDITPDGVMHTHVDHRPPIAGGA